MLLKVYDESGEMFEVIPSIAKKLIVNQGWFWNPPGERKAPFKVEEEAKEAEDGRGESVVSPG